jgi:trimethylamine corrinoid protein
MSNDQKDAIFSKLEETILKGEPGVFGPEVEEAIKSGVTPEEILDVVSAAMDTAGEMWDRLEIFLPEVVKIGETVKEGLVTLKPYLDAEGEGARSTGVVLLGTVEGDVHDIGRNVVGTMLVTNGFDVIDLGHDVPAETFIEKAEEIEADIIALSALMSTSMPFQEDVLEMLREDDLKSKYKVMVGGGPVTVEWTKEIGADGYGRTALDAVQVAKRLMTGEFDAEGYAIEGERK